MKEETKKITLVVIICLLTMFLVVIALMLNAKRQDSIAANSAIDGYLSEIKYEEITNHIVEKPDAVIYVTNSADEKSREFDKLFQKVIKKNNLENEVVYVNVNDAKIIDPIYTTAPELVFYSGGAISDIIDATTLKSDKEITQALKERSVIID